MKLTRAEAVRQCKELWRRIKDSGLTKGAYLDNYLNNKITNTPNGGGFAS